MSVVIRGMKMPKSCDECDLNYDCFRCILPIENSLLYGKDTANGRLPNCPLVELPAEHGRLIDAYELAIEILKLQKYRFSIEDPEIFVSRKAVMQAIIDNPTVIEAEEVSE